MNKHKQQRGVALITALMIVAIATTLIVGLTHQHQLDIRRTSNMINSDQAYQYAIGAESWAMALLYRDKQIDVVDHLKEDWAQILPPIEVPGGHITAQITDLQGRININNFYFTELSNNIPNPNNPDDPNNPNNPDNPNNPENPPPKKNTTFKRSPYNPGQNQPLPDIDIKRNATARQLLLLITNYINQPQQTQTRQQGLIQTTPDMQTSLNSLQPETIFTPLMDWMDPDIDVRGINGAEDQYYLGLEPPYRTANQTFKSISELRLVKGITPAIYHALAPHITALPVKTTININTAPPQVLTSMGIDPVVAETLITEREKTPYQTLDAFTQHPLVKTLDIPISDLTIMSDYFLLQAVAEIGKGRATINSVLYREKSGKVQILYRSSGQL